MSLVMLANSSDAHLHASGVDQTETSRSTSGSSISSPRSCEEHLAAQLGCLASQHHTSEYSCLKFGPKGAPVQYIPLSVQVPEYYKQLQDQQARYSTQAWWICQKPNSVAAEPSGAPKTSLPEFLVLDASSSRSELQEELLSAITSPLSPQIAPPHDHVVSLPIKTSNTHPINISFLIPTELIPVISSHLAHLDQLSSPVLFDIPISHQLHRLVSVPLFRQPSPTAASTQGKTKLIPVPGLTLPNWRHVTFMPNISKHAHPHLPNGGPDSEYKHTSASNVPRQPGLVNFLWNQKIAQAGKAVISTSYGFKIPGLPSIPISPTSAVATNNSPSCPGPNNNIRTRTAGVLPKNAYKAPFAAATRVQKHKPSSVCSLDVRVEATIVAGDSLSMMSASPVGKKKAVVDAIAEKPQLFVPSQTASVVVSESPLSCLPPRSTPAATSVPDSPQTIGNLFLSSCPGKKVRLTGPVNGRGAVCRDLRQDLQRMKDIGVGCVVCCLDDEELQFLGAPWDEYSIIASRIGLDVLRLPTPEGLAPPDPATLDAHLTRLIEAYTLLGIPVLVHCRGGVGRAGLIACCWALKLGLCGWIETQPMSSYEAMSFLSPLGSFPQHDNHDSSDSILQVDADLGIAGVRRDTMQLVERAIMLVRRRRSAKAVETFEQVRFLVEYVEFLRTKARIARERAKEQTTTATSETAAGGLSQDHCATDTTIQDAAVDVTLCVKAEEITSGSIMENDTRTDSEAMGLLKCSEA